MTDRKIFRALRTFQGVRSFRQFQRFLRGVVLSKVICRLRPVRFRTEVLSVSEALKCLWASKLEKRLHFWSNGNRMTSLWSVLKETITIEVRFGGGADSPSQIAISQNMGRVRDYSPCVRHPCRLVDGMVAGNGRIRLQQRTILILVAAIKHRWSCCSAMRDQFVRRRGLTKTQEPKALDSPSMTKDQV